MTNANEKVSIRRAGPGDLEKLDGLIAVLGYHKESGYFERCLAEQAEGRREIFIASMDGRDAGYAMLNWKPGYALFQKLGLPEIQDMNVIHALRRHGIAMALILHCEQAARVKGCAQMGIGVGLYADYGPAQRLYVKMGYIPDGMGINYDREPVKPMEIRPVDDDLNLMMVKDL